MREGSWTRSKCMDQLETGSWDSSLKFDSFDSESTVVVQRHLLVPSIDGLHGVTSEAVHPGKSVRRDFVLLLYITLVLDCVLLLYSQVF